MSVSASGPVTDDNLLEDDYTPISIPKPRDSKRVLMFAGICRDSYGNPRLSKPSTLHIFSRKDGEVRSEEMILADATQEALKRFQVSFPASRGYTNHQVEIAPLDYWQMMMDTKLK